jgi:hypothetical protein
VTSVAADRPLRSASDRLAGRIGLDAVEAGCLILLILTANVVLAALLTNGRPLSGADGLLAADQLQYFTWIREASEHGLVGNRFDLAPGDRAFLHPGFLLTGLLHGITGLSIPLTYLLLWKPVAIAITFVGSLLYVRRLLAPGPQRHAGLILALFAVMPMSAFVAWTGWGGKRRQYTFDFISGEIWTGQYLWGYLLTAVAVFTMPLVLLGLERWRRDHRPALLAWSALGALLVCWLQPWQGATLALIIVAVEGFRWWRNKERPAPGVAIVLAAIAAPAIYYFILGRVDAAWELAAGANAAGAQPQWKWPWWAIVLTLAPLAVPGALAYRRGLVKTWQDVAVRVWPIAAIVVYLLPLGTFPYHAFQGLALPLGILAVQGVVTVWPRPKLWLVVLVLLVMTVPGFIHKLEVSANSIRTAGDPFFVFDGEGKALRALESDPRAGGVLPPTYAGYIVPLRTGRESWIGPFSWTPDWDARQRLTDRLYEGPMGAAEARRFAASTDARFLFGDCRPGVRDLEPLLRPDLVRVSRWACNGGAPVASAAECARLRTATGYGCASVYELRARPAMTRVAGPPDA